MRCPQRHAHLPSIQAHLGKGVIHKDDVRSTDRCFHPGPAQLPRATPSLAFENRRDACRLPIPEPEAHLSLEPRKGTLKAAAFSGSRRKEKGICSEMQSHWAASKNTALPPPLLAACTCLVSPHRIPAPLPHPHRPRGGGHFQARNAQPAGQGLFAMLISWLQIPCLFFK